MDVFEKGQLIRIKKTGEVFTYESSTGGANFSSYLVVNVSGVLVDFKDSLHVDDVERMDISGAVMNDFKYLERGAK